MTCGSQSKYPGQIAVNPLQCRTVRTEGQRLVGNRLALAVDLFTGRNRTICMTRYMAGMLRGAVDRYGIADLKAGLTHLAALPEVDAERIGAIGFCMGGGFALLSAHDGYAAAAVNYGQLPRDLDAAVAEACPIVASYGRRDPSLRGAASRLDAALDKAGVTHDVKEYPAASHAFLNDTEAGPRALRPLLRVAGIGPEPESAKDAWDRIELFFATHLS